MSMQRRVMLKGALAGGTLGVAVSAGLLTPRAVLAAWPEKAFRNKDMAGAMKDLFGTAVTEGSGDIKIKAPDIAENGAVVPISVDPKMDGVESVTVISEKNPVPMIASFEMGGGATGFVSLRIKMGKTSNVVAVVKSGGKLYSAKKEVKVTIGGCGG